MEFCTDLTSLRGRDRLSLSLPRGDARAPDGTQRPNLRSDKNRDNVPRDFIAAAADGIDNSSS